MFCCIKYIATSCMLVEKDYQSWKTEALNQRYNKS